MKHVIVGSGPAGLSAARTLRRIAPSDRLVMVAEEAQPFYSKVLTSYFVGGKVPYENMLLSGAAEFQGEGVEILGGRQAVRVDPSSREVVLSDGERVGYDRLLLAPGASPAMPPIPGVKVPGVYTLWTHDDAVGMKDWVGEGQRAVVIGAGLVGLKAAEALMVRGLSVTVVELLDRVLPQILVKEDAARVRKELERRGLSFRFDTMVMGIEGEGRAQRVLLGDETALDCDVVVLATGVRPNLGLAKSAGVAIGRGILVDQFLCTSAPAIYAAGDAAEGWDVARGRKLPNPTWGNAAEQGRVAAHNMAGQTKPFNGAVTVNSLTFLGFAMAAVGITQPEGDYVRVESYTNPRTGDYRKIVLLGDRLVGGIAMGEMNMAGIWRGLIARKGSDGPTALSLLGGKTSYLASHGMGLGG